MSKGTSYVCKSCGHVTPKWMGRCPVCGAWNSLEPLSRKKERAPKQPIPIVEISWAEEKRISSGIEELDRILGGGVVTGSTILLGGDPGIGKSTLSLQVAGNMAGMGIKTLYLSGEESETQVALRGKRLGIDTPNLFIASDTDAELLEELLRSGFGFAVVDSIQTLRSKNVDGLPGGVSQVKAAMDIIVELAKKKNISVIIIGHITKEGLIAGPKTLEHMVDVVLYMEGERDRPLRILRAVKNRFGPTGDVGVFEMTERGLEEVKNPSQLFLPGENTSEPGSAIAPALVEKRPMLVEVQALTTETHFGMPKRTFIGFDPQRVSLIVSIMEKKLFMPLGSYDVFVSITGGLKLKDPGVDLAISASIMSSFYDKRIPKDTALFGEIGLTGEVKRVGFSTERIKECSRLGFKRVITPEGVNLEKSQEIEVIPVSSLRELKERFFS